MTVSHAGMPLGWRRTSGGIEPDEREREALALIRRLRNRGATFAAIAVELESNGFQSRKGNPYRAETVAMIVNRRPAMQPPGWERLPYRVMADGSHELHSRRDIARVAEHIIATRGLSTRLAGTWSAVADQVGDDGYRMQTGCRYSGIQLARLVYHERRESDRGREKKRGEFIYDE